MNTVEQQLENDMQEGYQKVLRVISSCSTEDHFTGATNLIDTFSKVFRTRLSQDNPSGSLYESFVGYLTRLLSSYDRALAASRAGNPS